MLLAAALGAALSLPATPGIHELTTDIPEVGPVLYAVSVPKGYKPDRPAPLVLVLHSGGERMRYYGSAFTKLLVEPALGDLKAIMLAPDCPSASWSDPAAEKTVLTLIDAVMKEYAIDRTRVLVMGYSMGGRGTWFMAAKHPELFTAAIPMAASIGNIAPADLGRMPTYVVHSRADQVVPFGPAEQNAKQLARDGKPVRFEALDDLQHFDMVSYVDALKRAGRWINGQWKR